MNRPIRLVGLLLALVIGLIGCTDRSPDPPDPSPAGSSQGSIERTSAEPIGAVAEVRITAPNLTERQTEELSDWGDLSIAVAVPVDITADRIPAQGIRLTRRYAAPLPDGAAATLAFFDPELETWRAVPSQLADDRRSVTAVVHHLSLWTDIVGGVTDGFIGGTDWGYFHVGKWFSVRADPPTCSERKPSWVDQVITVAPERNDPILFCSGADPDDPDVLTVKATVNRGFGFIAETTPHATKLRNTTADPEDLAEAARTAFHIDSSFAKALESLANGTSFVAGGETYTFDLTEDAAREAEGKVVTLKPPNVIGFLVSVLGRLVGTALEDQADGYLATALLLGACGTDFAAAFEDGTWGNALVTCIEGLDKLAARNLTPYLAKRKDQNGKPKYKDPAARARWIVGRATVYLALVGPAFDAMTYAGERNTSDAVRSLSVYVHPPPSATRRTFRTARVPAYCQNVPAQRLKEGKTTKGGPGEGWIDADAPAAFADFARRGYKQGVVAYSCTAGGVSWPQVILLVDYDGSTLASLFLEKRLLFGDRTTTRSVTVDGRTAVVRWDDYSGAGFSMTGHVTRLTHQQGRFEVSDRIVSYDPQATAQLVVNAARDDDRGSLLDPDAVTGDAWRSLVAILRGQDDQYVLGCDVVRTDVAYDCEIFLDVGNEWALAVVRDASSPYGWRVDSVTPR